MLQLTETRLYYQPLRVPENNAVSVRIFGRLSIGDQYASSCDKETQIE
jgi:hypothetical protein